MAQICKFSSGAGIQQVTATVAVQVSGRPSEGLRPWHMPRSKNGVCSPSFFLTAKAAVEDKSAVNLDLHVGLFCTGPMGK